MTPRRLVEMKIEQFFDPKNIEHLKAYKVLQETGVWPKGFIPEETEFGPGWQAVLAFTMANLYVNEQIARRILMSQLGRLEG
jgi:hypothetical protein